MDQVDAKSQVIAKIAFDHGFKQIFDYEVPSDLVSQIKVGSFVEVPLRNQLKKGTVVSLHTGSFKSGLKKIERMLSTTPLLSKELFSLATWISDYYCAALPDVIKMMLPSSVRGKAQDKEQYFVSRKLTKEELVQEILTLRTRSPKQADVLDLMLKVEKGTLLTELLEKSETTKSTLDALVKKGLLHLEKVKVDRSPLENEEYFPSKPKKLTPEQGEAFHKIVEDLSRGEFSTHLLLGVTGSGKTEVYLQAIGEALKQNKGAIVLVPEIALTAQTIERFRSRFEGDIAILHHRLSDGERHDQWKKIASGQAQIVIGARSAIFSPVKNLGLIIVDEEHETSYKQTDSMPTYHARDVAVVRGKIEKSVVLLGSATPSIESYYNSQTGKYRLSILKGRPEAVQLPTISLVDMRKEYEKKKGFTLFSDALLTEIEKRKNVGEQVILFLNRRGYHTLLLCPSCGTSVKCPACEVTLSYHKSENRISCHLCGHSERPLTKCNSCHGEAPLKYQGIGTEQVEAALYAIFPEIRVLRLDADTTKHKGSHQKLYRSFRTGKADILIGTQMIAKGLHFPEVTLVGILNSDMSLNIPDFRAGESTFQLMTQVAGRAGRGVTPGQVIIQTSCPENSVIQHASKQAVLPFLEEELNLRKAFALPPHYVLIKCRFSGEDLNVVTEVSHKFREAVISHLSKDVEVSIPSPPGHAKLKGQNRLQFVIKGPKITPLLKAIKETKEGITLPKQIKLLIDVNPTSTFF